MLPVEGIRAQTRRAARHWIWLLSQVPLVAMIITAFGVLNVMLASVRARRWEMGVLCSRGFTRATIIRTIIAEGLLNGVVAGCLSFSFGLPSDWCGAGFAQYISFFGGLHPQLIVPCCRSASGWRCRSVSRERPRSGGRWTSAAHDRWHCYSGVAARPDPQSP